MQNNYQSSDWYNPTYISTNNISESGTSDNRIDYLQLETIFINSGGAFGVYSKIKDIITLSEFQIFEVDKDGSYKITKKAKRIKQQLLDDKLDEKIEHKIVPAFWGTGLGDALIYPVKHNGKISLEIDPFIMNGRERIKVHGNYNDDDNAISAYSVINSSGTEVYKYNADQVYHLRYSSPSANPYFSASPSMVASKWLQLKYHIMQANSSIASGGMKASYLVGVDASKMKAQGSSPEAITGSMDILKEEIKQSLGNRNAGRVLFTPFPLTWQNIQMNNSEMRYTELLPYIDDEIYHAYGVDKSILDPSLSKYNNADKIRDALYMSLQSSIRKIEKAIETYYLPILSEEFRSGNFVFRIPRQFSQEEVELHKAKSEEINKLISNFKTLNETYSASGIMVFPTADKLKMLEEEGIVFKSILKEEVDIKPAEDVQLSDNFTKITNNEMASRNYENNSKKTREAIKAKLDKTFKKYLQNA